MKLIQTRTKALEIARKKTLEKITEKLMKRRPGRPPKSSKVIKTSENVVLASSFNKESENKPKSESKSKQSEKLTIRLPLAAIENKAHNVDLTNLPNSFPDINEFELFKLDDLTSDELLKNI